MKNKFVWILVLSVMVLGYFIWSQRSGLSVERVLPSHPLVFVRLDHVEEHLNGLIQSDFGKSVAAINLPDVLNRNNFSETNVQGFQHVQKNLARYWNNVFVKKFLNKEVSMALYRQEGSYQAFIVLRLTVSTRIAEYFGQLFNGWGDIILTAHEKYLGRTINHVYIKSLGLKFSYVRIRDLLIIVPSSLGDVKESLEVYVNKRQALVDDPSYNFVSHNAYPSSEGLVFLNLNSISDIWRSAMDARLSSLGYQAGEFPVYGLSYVPGKISKYKMLIGLNQQVMPLGMRKTLACPALANDTLKLVPVDAIAYNWGGCYDFDQTWGLARQRLDGYPDLSDEIRHYKRRLERHFHINIQKDILPVLGHEIGGYLTDLDMQGTYPFPRLLIFVKINDLPAAEKLLARLTDNPNLMFKSENYDHVDIHYIPLPTGGNMDPGYGFLDNYLLVSTTRQLLKRTIDAYTNSWRSIANDDVATQFSLTDGSKFNSVTLMKTGELSRRAQDFLGWIDRYLSGQVTMAAAYKQDGANKKQELDQAIADKSAELLLARRKLIQLQNAPLTDAVIEDPDLVNGAIANLSREEQAIKDDIVNYTQQKVDLMHLLDNYDNSAQTDKLTMYNMDNIVTPVLKGLESIDAQAVTVRYGDKILETEFLVK